MVHAWTFCHFIKQNSGPFGKIMGFLSRGGTSAPGELPLGTGLCIIVVNYIVLFLAREIYLAVNVANCITLFVYYFLI